MQQINFNEFMTFDEGQPTTVEVTALCSPTIQSNGTVEADTLTTTGTIQGDMYRWVHSGKGNYGFGLTQSKTAFVKVTTYLNKEADGTQHFVSSGWLQPNAVAAWVKSKQPPAPKVA